MPFEQSLGKRSFCQRPFQTSLGLFHQKLWQRKPTRSWVVGPWPSAASSGVGPFVKGQDGPFVKDQGDPFVKDQGDPFVKDQGFVKGHKALLAKTLQLLTGLLAPP